MEKINSLAQLKKQIDSNAKISSDHRPHHFFGGDGQLLHFAHSNGFHPAVFEEFLASFTEKYRVIGVEHRPFWQKEPRQSDDWDQVADDLIYFLDQQKAKKIIGVGHSLGAVATMFAAVKRPDLFRQLVLIDPVFLPALPIAIFQFLPLFLRQKLNPLIRITLRRQDIWETKQAAFDLFREKKVFAQFSDKTLQKYIDTGLKKTESGDFTLSYSKEWEAHFFSLAPKVWGKLKQLQIPVIAVRGSESNTLMPKPWARWQRLKPDHHFIEISDTGHLLPLEKPALVAEKILPHLRACLNLP